MSGAYSKRKNAVFGKSAKSYWPRIASFIEKKKSFYEKTENLKQWSLDWRSVKIDSLSLQISLRKIAAWHSQKKQQNSPAFVSKTTRGRAVVFSFVVRKRS